MSLFSENHDLYNHDLAYIHNNPTIYNMRNQNPPINAIKIDAKRATNTSFWHAGTALAEALFEVAAELVGVTVCADAVV